MAAVRGCEFPGEPGFAFWKPTSRVVISLRERIGYFSFSRLIGRFSGPKFKSEGEFKEQSILLQTETILP
jgi:hypothetical protein